jgi:hypothetical protein
MLSPVGVPPDCYDEYCTALCTEVPGFRVMKKSASRMHRAIHWGLVAVTFGQMRSYLGSFHTTIGKTVYVTDDWDDRSALDRYVTMRHEAVHLRQFRRWTLPGMALLYVFLPLPLGLAYFRARFEKEAYAETIRATAEAYGMERVRDRRFRDQIIGQFTGPSYGWMWPFRRSLERWYDRVVSSLEEAR